jgi:hypothetical protein
MRKHTNIHKHIFPPLSPLPHHVPIHFLMFSIGLPRHGAVIRPPAVQIPTKRVNSALLVICLIIAHVMPRSYSLRRIARPPGTSGREEPVVRNVANPPFLSYGLAHGDFFAHGHDVNFPGSAACAEIARPKGMFRIYHRSAQDAKTFTSEIRTHLTSINLVLGPYFSYRPVIVHRSPMTTSLYMRIEDV